jgi:hypothetical protein
MTPIQLALLWYAFIGLVWGYLVLHEETTNGSLTERFTGNIAGRIRFTVTLYILSAIAWPLSLWKYVATGRIRDLFV